MLIQLAIKFERQLDQHAPHSTVSACAMGICEKVYTLRTDLFTATSLLSRGFSKKRLKTIGGGCECKAKNSMQTND